MTPRAAGIGARGLLALLATLGAMHVPAFGAAQEGRFDVAVMPVRATDTTARVDVFVQLAYDQVAFRHTTDGYVAEFDLTVRFTTGRDSMVVERTFAERIVDTSYDVTVGRTGAVRVFQKRFVIGIGDYAATVTLYDRTSLHTQVTSVPVHVPDYAHAPVAMSGVLLATSIADVGGKRSIAPLIAADLSRSRQAVFAFFETYVRGSDTTLDAVVSVATPSASREVYRSTRVPLRLAHGTSQQFVRVQAERIPAGTYVLAVALVPHAADTATEVDLASAVARATRPVSMALVDGMPATQEDLETAIARLRWIAGPGDISTIESGTTLEDRIARYKKFWDDRDPTPGTQRNEARELYFARLRVANERYKVPGTEGYLTDQGMIYVIFGDPTSVENHPFETITYGIYHGPYQVWYYQRYNRNFVFVDQDGFGTFRLASPPPVERFQFGQ